MQNTRRIKVEVSARHCHLSQSHLNSLFGPGYGLIIRKELSQPGQFAAREKISLETANGKLEEITIVGPCRNQTQIEISATDARKLGLKPPVRLSGDLTGSVGGRILGPQGFVDIIEGIIIAERHIHCDLSTAEQFTLKNGDSVSVEVLGIRPVVFGHVLVRVHESFCPAFHIDTDEFNSVFPDGEVVEGVII